MGIFYGLENALKSSDFAMGLNYLFAWIAVALGVLLTVIWLLRIYIKGRGKENAGFAAALNKNLRKNHKLLGALLVIAGMLHGIFSSQGLFTLNWGSFVWLISILLGLSYMLRKSILKGPMCMNIHRALTIVFIIGIGIHIYDVGGVRVVDYLKNDVFGSVASQEIALNSSQSANKTADGSKEAVESKPGANSISSGEASSKTTSDNTNKENSSTSSNNSKSSVTQPNTKSTTPKTVVTSLFDGEKLKDGTYTGSADGYGPDLTVSVTVSKGKVSSIKILSHNERGERFYGTPMRVVPQEIIDSQSTDVDTISGATFTSMGIINAVKDALSGAYN